jgi:hypothetical protein
MEQITVIFQKHDGSSEQPLSILLDSKLSEYREEVPSFLGLPDKLPYRFVLLKNGKALSENQTFREAGVKENDRVALLTLDVWQEQARTSNTTKNINAAGIEGEAPTATTIINKPERTQDNSPSPTPSTLAKIIKIGTSLTKTLAGTKDWRSAVIIGGLIGGAIIIGFVSIIKPQITGGQSGNISIQQAPSLTKQQALDLVNKWIQAKREMFAPPYNRQLGGEITTGKTYDDNFGTGGSLEWLEQNGAYYRYGVQKIDSGEQFFVNGSDATVEVIVTEARTLYTKKMAVLTLKTLP